MQSGIAMERLVGQTVLPIFNFTHLDDARRVIQAGLRAGLRAFEILNRAPAHHMLHEQFAELTQEFGDEASILAGSIFNEYHGRRFIEANAAGLVNSRRGTKEFQRLCLEGDALYIPSFLTPSELGDALDYGDCQKYYPGGRHGPEYLKQILEPYGELTRDGITPIVPHIVVTGGLPLEKTPYENFLKIPQVKVLGITTTAIMTCVRDQDWAMLQGVFTKARDLVREIRG